MTGRGQQYFVFQSTLPAGGATPKCFGYISILREFQSTLPAGGATVDTREQDTLKAFQSTLPAGGATKLLYFV